MTDPLPLEIVARLARDEFSRHDAEAALGLDNRIRRHALSAQMAAHGLELRGEALERLVFALQLLPRSHPRQLGEAVRAARTCEDV